LEEKDGAIKIWLEEEIKVNCRYEKEHDFIQATFTFPIAGMTTFSKRYIRLLYSHPEINNVHLLPGTMVKIDVKVEKTMPFDLMVKKCLGVIAGAFYVRISE
jgi:hypothetical protein